MIDVPKISIIIPAYNAEQYISEAIQSVINQSYKNWELIIIDDGSSDETARTVKSFISNEKIKYYYQNNAGVSSARNKGIDFAQGKYLAFLDSDDLFANDNIYEKINYLSSNKDVGLVHGDVRLIDEKSILLNSFEIGKEGNVLDDLLLWNGCTIPAPSSILIRKEILDIIGRWDEELSTAADQELFFRIASKYKIGRIPKILTYYRIHKKNMHSNIKLMEKDHILAYKKAASNNLFKSFWFKQKCFSNVYLILAGSWSMNGNNKFRAAIMLLKAIAYYPPSLIKIFKKVLNIFILPA